MKFNRLLQFYFILNNMAEQHIEEEIAVSGSLFSVSLFEQKLMKNFLLISNKLRKLEGVFDLEQKVKNMQKEFKFISMKVDTVLQKLPKDLHTITKSDVKIIVKQQFFEIMNNSDDKIVKTKYHHDLIAEISKIKTELPSLSKDSKGLIDKKEGSKASFTAGQALMRQNSKLKMPKQSLQECLNPKEMEIVSQIMDDKAKVAQIEKKKFEDLAIKYDQLSKAVQQLRLGRGYASYLQRQAEKYQKFEQFEEKSRQTARKIKQKPIVLEGVKQQNVKVQIMKRQLLNQVQRMQLNKDEIAKHELMQKKTLYANSNNLFPQVKQANSFRDIKDIKDSRDPKQVILIKELKQKERQSFKRSGSIKKLQRLDRKLKVDDMKQLNSVLRQIQVRIQTKVSHDIFMGFVRDFQEKLELLRLSRDADSDISEIRKNLFVLESKVQSVVGYLQSLAQQDEALIVKKQWTCVSCDKGLQKYQGKVGHHLNWDNMNAKKMSPIKAGAFGQTGQLASKIRNLMQNENAE